MSLVPTCPRCDARTDPFGRDGGHSHCRACRDEVAAIEARERTAALKAAVQRRAA